MKSKKYVQFPLPLIAITDRQEAAAMMLAHSLSEGALTLPHKLPPHVIESTLASVPRPSDFDASGRYHQDLILSAGYHKVTLGSMAYVIDRLPRLHEFLDHRVRFSGGKDPLVRIRADIYWDARYDGHKAPSMAWDEFRVLVAIYSKIGRSPFRSMTRREIALRASGFRSRAVYENPDISGPPLLSERQVRTITDTLFTRKLFTRYTYRRSRTYYSHRMREQQLHEAVLNSRTFKARALADEREKRLETDARVQAMVASGSSL